jgi:CBS domain containing-hemolysin-like protein
LNFIFSGRKKTEIFTVSENELSVIATNAHKEGVLEISELNRVKNALAFDDTYIEKIMSSEDLESINIKNKTNRKIYDELCDTHHSRIIAYNGNKIIGYIKIRDLFKKIYMGDKFKIKDVIRPLTFVKNTMLISDVTKILIETSVSVFAVLDSKTNKTIGFITSDHIFSYLLGHPLRTETPKKKRK